LSGDGKTLLVGGDNVVWIHKLKDGLWMEYLKLVSFDFGEMIDLNHDGSTIIGTKTNIYIGVKRKKLFETNNQIISGVSVFDNKILTIANDKLILFKNNKTKSEITSIKNIISCCMSD